MRNTIKRYGSAGLAVAVALWAACSTTPSTDGDPDDQGAPEGELTFPTDGSALLVVDEVGGDATMTLKGTDDGTTATFTEWDINSDEHIVVAFDEQGRPATVTKDTLVVTFSYNADDTINFVATLGGVEFASGVDISLDDIDLDAALADLSNAKSMLRAQRMSGSVDFWIRKFTQGAMKDLGVPETRRTDEYVVQHPLYACMTASTEAQELAATMNAWLFLGVSVYSADCDKWPSSSSQRRRCESAQIAALRLSTLMIAGGEGLGLELFERDAACQHECVNDFECDEGWCERFRCMTEEPDNSNTNDNANDNSNDNTNDNSNPPENQPPRITEFTAVPDTCPDCFTQRGQGVGGVVLTCKAVDVDTPSLVFQIRAVGPRQRVPAKMLPAAQVQGEQMVEITRLLPGIGEYTFECEVFESNSSVSVLSDPVTVSVFPSAPMAGDWDFNYQDCTTRESKGWDSLILYASGEYGIGVAGERGTWTLDGGQFEADRDPGFFRASVDENNTHMIGEVISSTGNTTNCFEAWRGCVVREGETCELD
ncbi:MAG: hypothetical protein J5J06_12390 [Phycisphaerae bacterium]|nr:hypothetical protein [Phycisphaerae bacterium]